MRTNLYKTPNNPFTKPNAKWLNLRLWADNSKIHFSSTRAIHNQETSDWTDKNFYDISQSSVKRVSRVSEKLKLEYTQINTACLGWATFGFVE